MKIKETIERECCTHKDFKPLGEMTPRRVTQRYGGHPDYVFCQHCGRQHKAESFTDAAGSRDWEYRPLPWPWEQTRA